MSRPRKPVVSLLDRAIQYVSPAWAHSRHVHRVQMAMTGGYAGASYSGRLENWMPGQGDANADQIANLADLRGRSRDLVRNSPVAGGAAETAATYVIGAGLVLQSRINAAVLGLDEEAAREWQDQAESRFNVWSGSTLCDAVNEQVFADLQDLAWRSQWESGDVAVVLTAQETPGWPFRLALQIVEADRVSNPGWQPDTPSITAGMEYDSTGRLVAVHVCSEHPGAHIRRGNPKWTRITCRGDTSGRRNVLFLKRKLRPGQVRGIPEIAPIIGTLKQMDRYSDAEIDAAVNSALQAIFVKMDSMAFQEVFDPEAQTKIIDSAMKWGGGITGGRAKIGRAHV